MLRSLHMSAQDSQSISMERFEAMVARAVAAIPDRFAKHLDNVAFLVDEEPSSRQLGEDKQLHSGAAVLLGLYEGVPLPQRDSGYSGVVPDVITIFRQPHLAVTTEATALESLVHETVWHEVAHYFGLDHGQISALEQSHI